MGIDLREVDAGYVRGVPVLREVSLTVADGEIVTILGPNGSGKSTMLKAMMGYVDVQRGDVFVDGESVVGAPVHRRAIDHGVAYVPQLNNVFGTLSVRENLELGGHRLGARQRRARVGELLKRYPRLDERRRSRADALSGGERQMLAIARALMTRPRYVLLDEPSAGLSPLMLEELFEMLAEIRRQEEATVVLVEQNAVQALQVSDRGVVLVLGAVTLADRSGALLGNREVAELYLGGAGLSQDAV